MDANGNGNGTQAGYTIRDLVGMLGVSDRTVRRAIVKAGVRTQRRITEFGVCLLVDAESVDKLKAGLHRVPMSGELSATDRVLALTPETRDALKAVLVEAFREALAGCPPAVPKGPPLWRSVLEGAALGMVALGVLVASALAVLLAGRAGVLPL